MEKVIAQFVVFVLGVGWSVIFFLAKRTLHSIDGKMESGFSRMDKTGSDLKRMVKRNEAEMKIALRSIVTGIEGQIKALDKKIEDQNRFNKNEIKNHLRAQKTAYANLFVTRQEFGAFTATINHKIDSIYQALNNGGTKIR